MASHFAPISREVPSGTPFNDVRLVRRYDQLMSEMKRQRCSTLHRLGHSYSEGKAYYRFMANKKVNVGELIGIDQEQIKQRLNGRHILAIGDTTEISLKQQISHIQDANRVGRLSDNKTPGFLCHAQLFMDANSGHGLGLGSILLWNRKLRSAKAPKPSLPYEQRESYKWECLIRESLPMTDQAQTTTHVFDQEADIFDLFKGVNEIEKGQHHLIVRSHYNRSVEEQDQEVKLWDVMNRTAFEYSYELKLGAQNRPNRSRRKKQNRKRRQARIQLRYGSIQLLAPSTQPKGTPSQTFFWVEALEQADSVPAGEAPIHWRLLTTHSLSSAEEAMQIIRWYEKRWMIEQLFRLIKRKGFNIEGCQLQYLDAILKMTVMTLKAAFDVLRLLLARDNEQAQPITEVFHEDQIKCLYLINEKLQGNTEKQQNRHPPEQLSWATWVVARLGGWKGLSSQGLPGPITIKRGLEQFQTYYEAWKLFKS